MNSRQKLILGMLIVGLLAAFGVAICNEISKSEDTSEPIEKPPVSVQANSLECPCCTYSGESEEALETHVAGHKWEDIHASICKTSPNYHGSVVVRNNLHEDVSVTVDTGHSTFTEQGFSLHHGRVHLVKHVLPGSRHIKIVRERDGEVLQSLHVEIESSQIFELNLGEYQNLIDHAQLLSRQAQDAASLEQQLTLLKLALQNFQEARQLLDSDELRVWIEKAGRDIDNCESEIRVRPYKDLVNNGRSKITQVPTATGCDETLSPLEQARVSFQAARTTYDELEPNDQAFLNTQQEYSLAALTAYIKSTHEGIADCKLIQGRSFLEQARSLINRPWNEKSSVERKVLLAQALRNFVEAGELWDSSAVNTAIHEAKTAIKIEEHISNAIMLLESDNCRDAGREISSATDLERQREAKTELEDWRQEVGSQCSPCPPRWKKIESREVEYVTSTATVNKKKITYYTHSSGMEFVYVEPVIFMMGSPPDEEVHVRDEKRHEVKITRGFYISAREVSQLEYQQVIGNNPSQSTVGVSNPVDSVTWAQAVEFCTELEKMDALVDNTKERAYALPTEAQWEYTCRAGTTTPFYCGEKISDQYANFGNPIPPTSRPVGSYPANQWGIYDMHGNVWEWCSDWYDAEYYTVSPKEDPKGPTLPRTERVIRGGCWHNPPLILRSSERDRRDPGRAWEIIGFRVIINCGKQ